MFISLEKAAVIPVSECTVPGDQAGEPGARAQGWPGIGINHLQKLSGQTGGSNREKSEAAAKATAKFSLVPKAGLN